MDALAAIAAHAAAILAQLIAARDEPSGPGEDATTLAALRHTLVGLDVRAREAAEAVLTALEDLLRRY
jgi:hypothetical protein